MARGDIDADRRRKAVDALARDPNVTAAARTSGYSRCYIQGKLLKKPEFVAQIEARRQELADEAAPEGQQSRIVADSVATLEAIRDDPEAKDADRINAAKALLARFGKFKSKAGPGAPKAEPMATTPKPVLKFTSDEASRLLG